MSKFYENERYIILKNPEKIGYIVVNKDTRVTESEEECMPDAISVAEHLNTFMEVKVWEAQINAWREGFEEHQQAQKLEDLPRVTKVDADFKH